MVAWVALAASGTCQNRPQQQAAGAPSATVHLCLQDPAGRALPGALLQLPGHASLRTGLDGCAMLPANSGQLQVSLPGFESVYQTLTGVPQLDVALHLSGRAEAIDVTAARTPLSLDASASSVLTLSHRQLEESPGLTLDDALRQVAGFQLFRRTSSWVANPTIQGMSLRGLGSTAVSRTLILSDQIPLLDAFGGWVHWNEIPALAVESVEVMRGGASDLYGSSAIGGVIDVLPVLPIGNSYTLDLMGANHATSSLNGLVTQSRQGWNALAASSAFRTGGYILTAPALRGVVDTPANVHSENGRIEIHHGLPTTSTTVFLRGNILNEARGNGTPIQTNGTRLWRYAAGADRDSSSRAFLRLYGSDEAYRQSFSAIAPDRSSERLTRLQHVPTQQLGTALQWARTLRTLTFVAGGDLLDTRATDAETPIVAGSAKAVQSVSARQREGGLYGEMLWQPAQWSMAFSSRVDRFRSFDARQFSGAALTLLPSDDEVVFDPRLGIVRQLPGGVSLTGSVFRAFRGPSMNELYRTGQVGQQITLANPTLQSERATGFELGALLARSRATSLRASYFWTEVNRPVAAITLSSTATTLTEKRENLGQLRSRGVSAEAILHPVSWLTLTSGYQFALSTVTKFQPDPTLVGKWTPQVPRNSVTAQLRLERERLGVLSLDLLATGQQFDDSANAYRLAGYGQANLYAQHNFGSHWQVYASVENLLNHGIQAGRTPVLTLGTPRTTSVGLRLR